MNKIEYLTDYNHKYIINISPKYYMSSPKAQSLHEHEYAKKTGNGGEKVLQQKNTHASMYITPKNKNPLIIHEILEWPLQKQTQMEIFHPHNWLRQKNQ